MNKNVLIILLVFLSIAMAIRTYQISKRNPKIDLPEEHLEISKDSTKSTTLQGWYDKEGVLNIRFKP